MEKEAPHGCPGAEVGGGGAPLALLEGPDVDEEAAADGEDAEQLRQARPPPLLHCVEGDGLFCIFCLTIIQRGEKEQV